MEGFLIMCSIIAMFVLTGIMARKFHIKRESRDEMIAGVCSGIAKTCGIQPLWVRLGFVVSVLVVGYGIGLYIILWIVLPEE